MRTAGPRGVQVDLADGLEGADGGFLVALRGVVAGDAILRLGGGALEEVQHADQGLDGRVVLLHRALAVRDAEERQRLALGLIVASDGLGILAGAVEDFGEPPLNRVGLLRVLVEHRLIGLDGAFPVVLLAVGLGDFRVGDVLVLQLAIDEAGFAALAAGALMTVKLALTALCLGLVLGLLGALAKTSPYKPLQWLGGTYSTLVRGIPELLWVLLIYFGTVNLMRALGEFFGNPDLELNAFAAGVIALGLCFGAYATEVFRGAILAIPKGHREAGVALGLSKWRIFTKLIMPQMWRIALPGLGNLFMILMKDTALVSVIGLEEIMRRSQIAVSLSKEPFHFFLIAAFIYLSLTVLAMTAMHFLEKRASRGFKRSAS